ncbi:MAG: flagellar hook-basal body complex protein FliE [Alphaproteobacteria bacterium]|nr:flagellar hook-basal body complex protein FliE [Alphaproteobacteria bacterium]
MVISGAKGAQACANAAKIDRPTAPEPGAAGGTAGAGFAKMVEEAAGNAVGTLRDSERGSLQAVQGKADLLQVVSAVNNAEVTLQAVVAVRDKVIQAYQDIIRMPI